jgi:hypothetical protein
MNWYVVIEFLHIIAAMMFIGGIFGRQLVRAYAKKVDDVQIFSALSHAAGRIEKSMLIPGSMAVILLGVPLALCQSTAGRWSQPGGCLNHTPLRAISDRPARPAPHRGRHHRAASGDRLDDAHIGLFLYKENAWFLPLQR